MATTRLMPLHIGKNRTTSTAISDIIDYIENPHKTENGKFISSYQCDSRTADMDFLLSKRQYATMTGRDQGKRDVLAYQIRQSFKPGEITPEEANRLGYELAMAFTKGKHQFVVATHIDKSHIHNHIIWNSTAIDYTRKFKNFWGSTAAVRKLNDRICFENGLSIVENPQKKGKSYNKWMGDKKPPSFQDKMRQAIDTALDQKPVDFDSFLKLMEAANIECERRGKKLRYRVPGQKRFTESDTLKGDYTEQAIMERIEGKRTVQKSENTGQAKPAKDVNLLIDIQAKIQEGKGPGYERWARIFNLKQAAKTLMFLQENNLTDYDKLAEETKLATKQFTDLSAEIKTKENRMAEIAELQKQISTYSRTRDIYVQYRKAGYSKKFYAEHESEILLHQAAKKTFDTIGLKTLPKISALKQEYAVLLAEKKKLYTSYREAKEKMRALVNAKANADQLLRYSPGGTERETNGQRR